MYNNLKVSEFPYETIEEKIGYKFRNRQLCLKAFTHSSFAFEKEMPSNERLEFLGDSLLHFFMGDYLFKNFKEHDEGRLSKMKGYLVSRETANTIAIELEIIPFVLLGKGMQSGTHQGSIGGNLLEALIAAIYLDSDWNTIRDWVINKFRRVLDEVINPDAFFDFKSAFQEYCQRTLNICPEYILIQKEGPTHNPCFTMAIELEGNRFEGSGPSKKAAATEAAKRAYEFLNIGDDLSEQK
ncbi:ribonuclease III [Candidatus Riflebacteria bacterium]